MQRVMGAAGLGIPGLLRVGCVLLAISCTHSNGVCTVKGTDTTGISEGQFHQYDVDRDGAWSDSECDAFCTYLGYEEVSECRYDVRTPDSADTASGAFAWATCSGEIATYEAAC